MFILQIEHPVASYDQWKKVFDSDPIDRLGSGVVRYRIMRHTDNPNHVVVDLEFSDLEKAEAALDKLQSIWGNLQGNLITSPRTNTLEIVEKKELGS